MGHLIYGVAPAINVDDWALQHLRVVIVTKLRRDESFIFTWGWEPDTHGDDALSGSEGQYGSVWISRASSLYFSFDKVPSRALNRAWLAVLNESAGSASELRLIPEPAGT